MMARAAVRSGSGAALPASAPVAPGRPLLAKRALDLALTIPALLAALPIMLLAALLVRLESRGPALFHQTRIGRDERPFRMLKLRTMYDGSGDALSRSFNTRELLGELEAAAGERVFKPQHDARITRAGGVLRRFSIDELPQLLNVIRGEMSLVGPRPSLPWEVELYTPEQRRRHGCPPGMTGLWQVSGRNRLSMPEMLALDLVYAERRSLGLDLWILLRTPRAVLFDRDTR